MKHSPIYVPDRPDDTALAIRGIRVPGIGDDIFIVDVHDLRAGEIRQAFIDGARPETIFVTTGGQVTTKRHDWGLIVATPKSPFYALIRDLICTHHRILGGSIAWRNS